MEQPPQPAVPKAAGPNLWLSLVVLGVGLALMSWGIWSGFQSSLELLFVDSFETPGSQVRDLDPGTYEIYGQIASVDIFAFEVSEDIALPSVDDIAVTNVDTGDSLLLEEAYALEPLGRQSNFYDLVATFTLDQSGRYEVAVDAPNPSRAVFGRSIESAPDRLGTPILVSLIGLAASVLGAILLIVGLIRRKRQRDEAKQATNTFGATPGVYGTPPPPPAITCCCSRSILIAACSTTSAGRGEGTISRQPSPTRMAG